MHDGCSGSFSNGKMVVDKIRAMGFAAHFMPAPLNIVCEGCASAFTMDHFEEHCPQCGMVHGVTPCHAWDVDSVQAAGVGY